VNRVITPALFVSLICCGVLPAGNAQNSPAPAGQSKAAANDAGAQKRAGKADKEVLAHNRAFEDAFARANVGELGGDLLPDFTWIDSDGVLQDKQEVLGNLPSGTGPKLAAISSASGAEVIERTYGQVAFVQVHSGTAYSLRVFQAIPSTWHLLHVIDAVQPPPSAQPASGAAAAVPSEAGVDTECINPCKIVPFKPATPGAKAAFSSWLELERGSLVRDMDLWGRHVLDDCIIVDSGGHGVITKSQRMANTLKQKQAGVRTNEVPPVLWARTFDFGESVLLLMLQQPYTGQPYYATRILVNRAGRYQMAVSYHTSIAWVPDFALSKQLPSH
jgi:uncharacterized protein DUF4440